MKKFLTAIVFILMIFSFAFSGFESKQAFALESGKEASVIASRCDVYQSTNFPLTKVVILDGEEEKNYTLKHGQKVEILSIENDFAQIKSEDEIEGFVYKYYLTQNSSQVVYPVFNGTIRNDTIIYDIDIISSGYSAKKGDRVFIYKSFEEKKDYTAVQVVLQDGILYNGYVLTKDVNPDGVNSLLIVGISIISAAVTIVLAIIFIKKGKKKKKA